MILIDVLEEDYTIVSFQKETFAILFPLEINPMGPIDGNPHILRAGKDYPVWQSSLPEGYVILDEVRLAFPER